MTCCTNVRQKQVTTYAGLSLKLKYYLVSIEIILGELELKEYFLELIVMNSLPIRKLGTNFFYI